MRNVASNLFPMTREFRSQHFLGQGEYQPWVHPTKLHGEYGTENSICSLRHHQFDISNSQKESATEVH